MLTSEEKTANPMSRVAGLMVPAKAGQDVCLSLGLTYSRLASHLL